MLKLIIPILVLALFASACGGGDAASEAPTKAEFITQADVICKKADRTEAAEAVAYEKAHLKAFSGLSVEAVNEKLIVAIALPSILKEVEGIEALGAPKGDEEEIQTIIKGIHETIKKAEEEPESLEARSGGLIGRVNKLTQKYGFKDCSEII